ncbi:hypothetical protein [Ferrovibrio sp.]|uniref:hypothetical protein n=1 Tax=Ferrovibrio sp. TaxID=1917215 RepID=UPI002637FADD|nr:hypothetical protein [Ferrovibrio sp.]
MLFRPPKPSERDILPWWHPHALLRAAWNLAFSAALGLAAGAIALDLAAQVVAKIAGAGSEDWRDWHDPLRPLAWLLGCFVAFVAYMSYRMDDKTES